MLIISDYLLAVHKSLLKLYIVIVPFVQSTGQVIHKREQFVGYGLGHFTPFAQVAFNGSYLIEQNLHPCCLFRG